METAAAPAPSAPITSSLSEISPPAITGTLLVLHIFLRIFGIRPGSTSANVGNAYGAAGVVSAAQGVTSQKAYVVSDTTVNFTLKRGSAYCFKMTVVNGNAMTPGFTVGNGDVLKTQFVAKVGNDYYYRVYATGTPGQSTGVYTTLPGQNAVKHCTVTIG